MIPHYDIIIIGAGSIGTPTAFSLAKVGLHVLVLDRYASVGQASNKRAIGGVRATHSDPAKIQLCQRSIDIYSQWKETFGDEIEWYKGGYVFVAYHPEEEKKLKDLLVIQKSFGLNITWLDQSSLLEVIPGLNADHLLGGTYSPDDGSASPLLAIHAFYDQAQKLGAEFHFNEQVVEMTTQNHKIDIIKTNKEAYTADVVINAAGPWACQVAELVGVSTPVYPDAHEAAITEPVQRFIDPMIVDIRMMPGSSNFYFYQHFTGQILFCMTPNPAILGYDTEETASFLPMAARRLIELMPKLCNIRVRRTWRGLYPMTPDGSPIVGLVNEVEGFLLAVGMCGQGFMLGPGLGELLARMVSNNLNERDLEILPSLSPYRQFTSVEKLK
jgi:sarcosine oxidase subunit beta